MKLSAISAVNAQFFVNNRPLVIVLAYRAAFGGITTAAPAKRPSRKKVNFIEAPISLPSRPFLVPEQRPRQLRDLFPGDGWHV
jgi:hypothetical protein